MTTDPLVILLSAIIGFPLGLAMGTVTVHYIADKLAAKAFDALLQLRQRAREQMDQHEAMKKGSSYAINRTDRPNRSQLSGGA